MTAVTAVNRVSPKAQINIEIRDTQTRERERVLSVIDLIAGSHCALATSAALPGDIQRGVMRSRSRKEQTLFLEPVSFILGHHLKAEKKVNR